MPYRRFTSGLALLTAVCLTVGSLSLIAQPVQIQQKAEVPDASDDSPRESRGFADGMSLPTDRQASQRIRALKEYLANQDDPPWETIVEAAQKLLELPQDSLLDVPWTDAAGKERVTKVSIRAEVNRLIGDFPPAGKEFYQSIYGPKAKALLDRARFDRDPSLLAEASQRYLYTDGGAEATRLLAGYYLDRGRYQESASCYNRLLRRSAAEEPDAKTLYLAALAFRRAGDAQAEDVWKRFLRAADEDMPEVAGRAVTMADLEGEYDREDAVLFAALEGWTTFRGGPTRNATGIGTSPFLDPRFSKTMLPVSSLYDDYPAGDHPDKAAQEWTEQHLDESMKSIEGKTTPLPAFYPIAVDGKILYRDYKGISAVFTEPTVIEGETFLPGEVAWRSPAFFSIYELTNSETDVRQINQWWVNYNNSGPNGILFENGLNGTLSHDGQNVYFVDDMALPPHPELVQQHAFNRGGAGMAFTLDPPNYGDPIRHNRLVAIDVASGVLRWTLGGEAAEVKAKDDKDPWTVDDLNDAHFLGTPLPVGGMLYVVMEKAGKLYLVCLDPPELGPVQRDTKEKKPAIAWVQPLGTPDISVDRDTLRRIQGVNLAFADGVLVIPTNAGVVIGVELVTRSLLWAHPYRSGDEAAGGDEGQPAPGQPVPARMIGGRVVRGQVQGMPDTTQLNEERWRACAPIIADGKMVFTAFDSQTLQCLELRGGKPLWSVPRGSDDLYLAGVFDGQVVIVSRKSIRAVSLEDGTKELWSTVTGTPAGLGVASDGVYYLPIKSGAKSKAPEVWAVRLKDGKDLARTQARKREGRKTEEPGNLIFYKGDVYSQTARELVAYPQLKRQLEEMNRRLKENPRDPVGLTERGALRLDEGKLVLAVADLRTALSENPEPATEDRAKRKLYQTLSQLFDERFDEAEKYLDDYRELCDIDIPEGSPPERRSELTEERLYRRSNFLSQMGTGREEQGRLVEAFDFYMEFGTLRGNDALVEVPDDLDTATRPDVWARGRIETMLRRARAEQRRPLEERIAEKWAETRDGGDLGAVRGFVSVFGTMTETGREAKLSLAEMLIATEIPEDLREAELLLTGLRGEARSPGVAARATEALARLFVRKARLGGDEALFHDAVAYYDDLGERFADVEIRDGKTGTDYLNDLLTDKRFLPYLEPVRQVWEKRLRGHTVHKPQVMPAQASFTVEPEGAELPFYDRHRLVMDLQPNGRGTWTLRVEDRVTGRTKCEFTGLPAGNDLLRFFQQRPFRFAKAHGHMLLLNLNHMVYALDLADGVKLWEYNLFGKLPMQNTNPGTQVTNDGIWLVYQNGYVRKLGQLGVITSNYVCLQTRLNAVGGLIALDPATGEPLWTKADVSPRVELFGDETYVFIQEFGNNGAPLKTRCVQARDGAAVDVADVSAFFRPGTRQLLAVRGRHLLITRDDGGQIALHDPISGEDVWKRDLGEKDLVVRDMLEGNLVGYATAEGEFVMLDIDTGEPSFRASFAEYKHVLEKAEQLQVLDDGQRLYLCVNRTADPNVTLNPCLTQGLRWTAVNGPMVCFDRASRETLWVAHMGQFANQHLLLERFTDLPLIIGAVYVYERNNGRAVRQHIRVVAVDKRTGKMVFRDDMSPNQHFYTLTSDVKAGSIELLRHDLRVEFLPENSPLLAARSEPGEPAGPRAISPPSLPQVPRR